MGKNLLDSKESAKRIGHLEKSDKLKLLRPVEDLIHDLAKENGLEASYDVLANELPYFKTIAYTEWAGNLIVYPLCNAFRFEQIDESYWGTPCPSGEVFIEYLASQFKEKNANKYKNRNIPDSSKFKKNLVVLLGTNKLKKFICLNKLMWIKKNLNGNVVFKPHPLTTFQVIGELQDLFGEEQVAHREEDVYCYLEHADTVYATHHSETVAFAVAIGKKVDPIDVYQEQHMGAFSHINRILFTHSDPAKSLNKVFFNHKSGIINPLVDNDWEEKLVNYFKYICEKRESFKDKYIFKEKKKSDE